MDTDIEDNRGAGDAEDALDIPVKDALSQKQWRNKREMSKRIRQLSVWEKKIINDPVAPDGGWGWIVCLGSFTINFILDGTMFSFGILMFELLSDFEEDISTTSWVGSSQMGIHMCMGPVVSILMTHFSIRQVVVAGSLLSTAGFVISMFAPNIYVLILTYGVISGIGFGLIFLPGIIIVGFYFTRKRAIATGIATSGSGFGTFAYAYLTVSLIDEFTWRGAILLLGGLLLNCVVCGMVFRPLPRRRLSVRREAIPCRMETPEAVAESIEKDSFSSLSTGLSKRREQGGTASSISTTITSLHPSWLLKVQHPTSGTLVRQRLYRSMEYIHYLHTLSVFESNEFKREQRLSQAAKGISRSCINLRLAESVPGTTVDQGVTHGEDVQTSKRVSLIQDDAIEIGSEDIISRSEYCFLCREFCETVKYHLSLKLLSDKTFILLLITFTMWTAQSVTLTYLPELAVSKGISTTDAAFLISIVGIANVLGRFFAGFLTDCFQVPTIWLYVVALSLAAVINLALPFCKGYEAMAMLSAAFGLCMAVAVSMRTIVLVEMMGVQALIESFGVVALFQGIAFGLGPPIAGKLVDEFSSFKLPYLMAACMYSISALSSVAIGIKHQLGRRASRISKLSLANSKSP